MRTELPEKLVIPGCPPGMIRIAAKKLGDCDSAHITVDAGGL
jgi:hypothetical protein